MVRFSIFCLLTFIYIVNLNAQTIQKPLNDKELGFSIGAAYYLGDINPFIPFIGARQSFGLFYKFNRNYRWCFKTNLLYGRITANDENNFDTKIKQRNLSFQSNIFELSHQIEFNFLPYRLDDRKYKFAPYSFIGLGIFYYNPKAKFNGNTYVLKNLSTEGQGIVAGKKEYKNIAICIPMGMGIKYCIRPKTIFTLEYSIRKTFTDYIDDVSGTYVNPAIIGGTKGATAAALSDRSNTSLGINNVGLLRGNPDTRDWYGFLNIGFSFMLPRKGPPCDQYK